MKYYLYSDNGKPIAFNKKLQREGMQINILQECLIDKNGLEGTLTDIFSPKEQITPDLPDYVSRGKIFPDYKI